MKGAFCFLASNDYMPAMVVALRTLGRVTRFPMLILDLGLTEENREILTSLGGTIRQVEPVNSAQVKLLSWHYTPQFAQNCFRKLNMWSFTEYDTVIFLDGDIYVKESIDELMYVPHDFSACSTTTVVFDPIHGEMIRAGWNRNHFNAGLLVIKPNMDTYHDLLSKKDTMVPADDPSDEGFLNVYYKNRWNRLPPNYNVGRMVFQYMPHVIDDINVKMIHYASEKPWKRKNIEDREPIDHLWWQEFGDDYHFPETPHVNPQWWEKHIARNREFLQRFQARSKNLSSSS